MKDNEWAGIGNSLDYGARMEDTRIARFRSLDNMNNPSGVWKYTGKELVFSKVEGEENTYSVDIKLNYSYSTTGKGAAEGERDVQTSQTIKTGIKITKTDDFTYQSNNLK